MSNKKKRTEPTPPSGYAHYQIAKALRTASEHPDETTRQRAQAKIDKWHAVLESSASGTNIVGSRTPLKHTPSWVTLEVVTGGFATGGLMAGGPLQPHESAWIEEKRLPPDSDQARLSLNRYFLSDDGLHDLQAMLQSGRYKISVPEEGALLTVAWLLKAGAATQARRLISEIAPFFDRLRFYPIPTDHPIQTGSRVNLYTLNDAIQRLQQIKPSRPILTQETVIRTWLPLYDEMIGLFLETVHNEPPPDMRRDGDGQPIYQVDGKFQVIGGWPCQTYPEDWDARAQTLLSRYATAEQNNPKVYPSLSLFELHQLLKKRINTPQLLSGKDVGRIRLILARANAKRGLPGSLSHQAIRQQQQQQIDLPKVDILAQLIIQRLDPFSLDSGLDGELFDTITTPVSAIEAEEWPLKAETTLPDTHLRKLMLSRSDTIPNLIRLGVLRSSESLARVLPQITSEIRAAGITEPQLRALYAAIYKAFRQRRSLLLLNLESQVKIEELPWVNVIERQRDESLSTRQLATQTLEEVSRIALTAFPETMLPNKLIQEMRALATSAGLNIPLLEELAADIFMGQFSPKYEEAAHLAASLLSGSLYDRYYGLQYAETKSWLSTQSRPNRKKRQKRFFPSQSPAEGLYLICSTLAGVETGWGKPARNGMIIEQQQIYTTQNLATLFQSLGLKETLETDQLEEMALTTFRWLCHRLQVNTSRNYHAGLIKVKVAAYAWRQMIFFLSLLPEAAHTRFMMAAEADFAAQPAVFQQKFRPVLLGLWSAIKGEPDNNSRSRKIIRPFLGWSEGGHWFLD